MSKLLSIIIPRYNETEYELFPLLTSINNQVGINFDDIEVILSNDGGGDIQIDGTLFDIFNFDIRQVYLTENKGPGVARQNGLDHAYGDYVMFCDADDILHSVAVIGAFISEIKQYEPDILSSSWLEEIKDQEGHVAYLTKEIENTWMFGKVLKRSFLSKHNICFHDDLRVHEDSYFLSIAAELAESRRHLNMVTYVWRFKPDSITRRNNGLYTWDSMPTFIDALIMSIKELEDRGYDKLSRKVAQFICYIYFTTQSTIWSTEEVRIYLDAMEDRFKERIKPYWMYYNALTKEEIAQIYSAERNRNFNNQVEHELFTDWAKRMGCEEAENSK